MKKLNKIELVGFAILIIAFILFLLSSFTDIQVLVENRKIFQIAIFIGLIMQISGMAKRKNNKND